jgi:WD40 repeat protein
MKKYILLFLVCTAHLVKSQTKSAIYLYDLKYSEKGEWSISGGTEIIKGPEHSYGRPFFHPEEPIIYFSSFNEVGFSNLMSFNYKTNEIKTIVRFFGEEYSGEYLHSYAITPDKKFISYITQQDPFSEDQKLVKYSIYDGEPVTLISDLTIGNYAWINSEQLILFVQGEEETLRLYNLRTKRHEIIDDKIRSSIYKIPGDIKRIRLSLRKIPGKEAVSYVRMDGERWGFIRKVTLTPKATTDITATAPNARWGDDYCWTPNGNILMTGGNTIYSIDPNKDNEWKWVVMFTARSRVSELAVSNDGKKLAIIMD